MSGLAPAVPARSDQSALSHWMRTLDWGIVMVALLLVIFGGVLSLAAGPPAAERMGYADPLHFVKRHGVFAIVSLVLLLGFSTLSRHWVRRLCIAAFLGSFVLMAYILMFEDPAKGAQRWVRLAGFSLQPSEFIKPALVVVTAWLLSQREIHEEGPWVPASFLLFVCTIGFLVLQPDIGQSALLTAAFVMTFFICGLQLRYVLAFGGGSLLVGGALYTVMPHMRHRFLSLFSPDQTDTFQIEQARQAILSGGWLGRGPGEGVVTARLPDPHTDFIFAVMVEEYGFIAGILVIAGLGFICMRGIYRAGFLQNLYARAAASGLFALIGLQTLINVGVNLGVLPPKGMTLPFISYGGSSMMGLAMTLGLGLALIRDAGNRRMQFE